MKHLQNISVAVLLTAVIAWFPCQSSAEDIFGFTRGMSIEDVKALKEKLGGTVIYIQPDLWGIDKPQIPDGVARIILTLPPDKGLLHLLFVWEFESDRFGTLLKRKFNDLHAMLSKKYGKGEKLDRLIPGSMWEGEEYFMVSLYKKERFLQWCQPHFYSRNKWGLEGILLDTVGLGTTKGKIGLSYNFQGYVRYYREKKDEQNSGF